MRAPAPAVCNVLAVLPSGRSQRARAPHPSQELAQLGSPSPESCLIPPSSWQLDEAEAELSQPQRPGHGTYFFFLFVVFLATGIVLVPNFPMPCPSGLNHSCCGQFLAVFVEAFIFLSLKSKGMSNEHPIILAGSGLVIQRDLYSLFSENTVDLCLLLGLKV